MRTLDAIINRFGAGLARVAASYEADRELARDLLQDILLEIHRALPSLRDPERLGAFVFRIAHNRGVTHVIRQKAARRIASPDLVDAEPDPERALLATERAVRLIEAVRRLPLPYRQVVTLVLEELSHAEIADALGLSVSNVAVRVHRAKALLKELLDEP